MKTCKEIDVSIHAYVFKPLPARNKAAFCLHPISVSTFTSFIKFAYGLCSNKHGI